MTARTSSENVTSGFCKAIRLAKCVLVILELNWNKRFSGKNAKLNICDLSSYAHVIHTTAKLVISRRGKN